MSKDQFSALYSQCRKCGHSGLHYGMDRVMSARNVSSDASLTRAAYRAADKLADKLARRDGGQAVVWYDRLCAMRGLA